jgi:hypothetical protein
MKQLLIIKCLKDDHDGSMDAMASCFKKNEIEFNSIVVDMKNISTFLKENKNCYFDKVRFAGHSFFHLSPVSRKIQKIEQRTIGGYKLEEIINLLKILVTKFQVKEINLCGCCESAWSKDTKFIFFNPLEHNFVLDYEFSTTSILSVGDYLRNQKDESISTMMFIAYKLKLFMLENHNEKKIIMEGVNGMGYIQKGKEDKSFDCLEHFEYFKNKFLKKGVTYTEDDYLKFEEKAVNHRETYHRIRIKF